jgi:hypothetical protein
MAGHVWSLRAGKHTGFELLDRIAYCTACTDHDLDSGGTERLEGIWPAIVSYNRLHILLGYELRCLNARSATECHIGVLQGSRCQRVYLNNDKTRASSEARVHGVVKRLSLGRNGNTHDVVSSRS